ncbi:MAG: sulfur carrier protein ThiS, partial [Blastocatellia bacterium]
DEREAEDGAVITDLIAALDLKPERVAVELNGRIIRKTAWAETVLNEGDRLEIVHFVGGG